MEPWLMWPVVLVAAYGLPLLIYLAFAVPALYFLRTRDLDDTAQAVWALAPVAVPVMGAVAYAAIAPGSRRG